MNTLKTKGQGKGHSGIPMDLCTREPGPRDRGTVTVFTRIQTEINTRGSGKRATDTDRESISTKIKVLDTRVGIDAKSVRRRALGVRILGKKLQVSKLLALDRYRKRVRPPDVSREFKITTTATATGTSLNKRFNEENNGYARAL